MGAAPELQSNNKFVMAALKANGLALQYTSAAARDNVGLVMAAVRQNGTALSYAAHRFRNHVGVLEAVRGDGRARHYVDARLRERDDSASFDSLWSNPAT